MRDLLTAITLLSLSIALRAVAAPCPGTVVFQDSFTSPSPNLDVKPDVRDNITIQGGKAEITFTQPNVARNEEYGGVQYGDVHVCSTFTTAATDKPENQSAGLMFWGGSDGGFYTFQFDPAHGNYALLQQVPGTGWSVPVPWTASAAIVKTLGSPNTLQVQTKGNVVTMFINGQNVGTYTGTPPPGGGLVGFSVSDSTNSTDTWDVTDFSVSVP